MFSLKNHSQNVVEKLLPNPFLKNQNQYISESIAKSLMQFVYIVCQVESCQNILKLSYRPLAFTLCKAFLKNQKRSRTGLPSSFCYILLTGQISLSGCL